ncbi:amidase [Demequina zhanjiangensis]|uniref:Amidase n=1 Tax=Demequina zhanjiangensis TaxID=3051659 RepID=A0ABT8G4S8_9MICO|nr:amidase [Demequina sp. SYSU T00b26]MDN4474151.1 amidase [Demequina sp. SYSU T00b26]
MNPTTSVIDLAAALQRREVSAVETARLYLDRIDALNPGVNAIVWMDREDVLQRAEAADARLAAGTARPFEGVPMPIKDLMPVAGQPCTMASLGVSDAPAQKSDLLVTLLEDAGFVLFGRTNSPEFGSLTVSENERWGTTRNPWNLAYTSGGSSGGASAAVAAGLAPIAQAGDGGGSIRVPSAATGLVGLKASRGRVPTDVRGWEHGVSEGFITRTVADTAAVMDAVCIPDLHGWYTAPPQKTPFLEAARSTVAPLRVGLLLTPPTGVEVDDDCIQAAMLMARTLEEAGHTVVPVDPFMFNSATILGFTDKVLSAAVWAEDIEDPSRLAPYIRRKYERAQQIHAGEYVRLTLELQAESRQVVSQWGKDFDVLLTPTTACVTPPTGVVTDDANDPDNPSLTEVRTVSFTAFANIAGLPAISLPVTTDSRGMPVGAQLVGGPYDEATLLSLAADAERRLEWHTRIAPIALTAGV